MRLPWFMHAHRGENTLVGVMPTPVGTFVRSAAKGAMEVAWYPMDPAFPGGEGRECKRLASVPSDDEGERRLEQAVVDFMHAHPVLALTTRYDVPGGGPLVWDEVADGALATLPHPCGLFFRIHHAGTVTLEFLPAGGFGNRETLGTFADTCDERTLANRIDGRLRRRVDEAEARAAARREEAA